MPKFLSENVLKNNIKNRLIYINEYLMHQKS